MGAFGVEPRIEMAADSTAHIVFDKHDLFSNL
jgi:hypothetical protein